MWRAVKEAVNPPRALSLTRTKPRGQLTSRTLRPLLLPASSAY